MKKNELLDHLKKICYKHNPEIKSETDSSEALAELISKLEKEELAFESSLLNSEEKYKQLFEDFADATLIIEGNNFVDCNIAALQLLRFDTKEKVFNTHPSKLSPQFQPDGRDSVEKANEMIAIAFEKGSHRFEWVHKKADGEHFDAEVLLTKMRRNNVDILHCVWRDITERKKADKALQLSETRYKFLFEEAADGILVGNVKGEIIKANESAFKLTGYNESELIGQNISILFSGDELGNKPLRYDLVFSGKTVLSERKLKRKDGAVISVEMNTRMVNENTVQTYIRNVTERKIQEQKIVNQNIELEKTKAELKSKNNKLSLLNQILEKQKDDLSQVSDMLNLIIDHIPVGVFWKDLNLNYLGCNNIFLKNVGLNSVVDIVGKDDFEINHPQMAEKYKAEDLEVINTGKPMLKIEEPLMVDGRMAGILLTNKVPLMNSAGKIIGILGTYEDISEIKKIQEKLIIAKEKAEESDRLKSAFLANMSHEIRTPMNGILGFAQLLQDQKLTPERQDFYIGIINQSGNQLLGIINDLVDMSKVESGLMEASKNEIYLYDILHDQLEFFAPEAKSKNINLINSCVLSKEETFVVSDAQKVKQVFTNIIKNAIKFTESGGSVEVNCIKDDDFYKYSIRDTGFGIPDGFHDKVFKRFQQANENLERNHSGSGLGLAISKAFVELLGGEIWFDSKQGVGSTFYFTIPYKV